MAQVFIRGEFARVELIQHPDTGQVNGKCDEHSPFDGRLAPPGFCAWVGIYDDWSDAVNYASSHADKG